MKAILFSLLTLTAFALSPASAQPAPSQSAQQAKDEVKLSADVAKLFNEGKFDEALPLARRLLSMREQVAGKDTLVVAAALNTIGMIYLKKEKYFDASPFFQRSLKITETIQGADSLSVSMILDRLALISYFKGDYDKTEEQYNRALAIREKLLGATNIEVLNSLSRLADFYQLRRDYKKAETYLQRIITVKEGASVSPGSLAETIYQYACLKRKMNDQTSAESMEARAGSLLMSDAENALDVAPPDVGTVNGRALTLAKPAYPEQARATRETGDVEVQVVINEAGKVIRACAMTGSSVFWRGSEAAAYRSVFSTTTLDGKPIKVTGIISYHYVAN